MKEQQSNKTKISIRKQDYLLQIQNQIHLQKLIFRLWTLKKAPKFYLKQITNQTMQQDIKKLSIDINLLFECCRTNCQVNTYNAAVNPLIIYQFKNKRVQKRVIIRLFQQYSDHLAVINIFINQIHRKIFQVDKLYIQQVKNDENEQKSVKLQNQEIFYQKPSKIQQNLLKVLKIHKKLRQQQNILKIYNIQRSEAVQKIKNRLEKCQNIQKQLKIKLNQVKKINFQQNFVKQPKNAIDMNNNQQNIKKEKILQNKKQKIQDQNINIVKIIRRGNNSNFRIQKNCITLIKEQQKGGQILINYPMRHYFQKNKFRIKVIKSFKCEIKIGILDKGNANTLFTKVATVYEGASNYVFDWNQKKKQGDGFTKNDIIDVILLKGEVQWLVNGKLQASYQSNKLQRHYLTFLPIIQLKQQGDCVQWIPL